MGEDDIGIDRIGAGVKFMVDERNLFLLTWGKKFLPVVLYFICGISFAPRRCPISIVLPRGFSVTVRKFSGGVLECDGAESCGFDFCSRYER